MRCILTAAAVSMLSTASLAAQPVVTESIRGVINGSNTIDTSGYFGAAGANLNGSAMVLTFDYVPADYNTQGGCAHHYPCKTYEAFGTTLVPKSFKVSITINAHTVSFSPTVSSLITIFTNGTNFFLINSDPGNSIVNGGIQVALTLASQPAFGAPLSPTNPPLKKYRGDLFEIFSPNGQASTDVLTFSVNSSAK